MPIGSKPVVEMTELLLLAITAAATTTGAIVGWLTYKARYTVPRYMVKEQRVTVIETDSDTRQKLRMLHCRTVRDPHFSDWRITEVCVSNYREKWLAKIDWQTFEGNIVTVPHLDWKRRIKLEDGDTYADVILHSDAPKDLNQILLSLRIKLIANERVVRKVWIRCALSSIKKQIALFGKKSRIREAH